MDKTMNLMQFVYSDKASQVISDEMGIPYREAMASVLHEFLCIQDSKFSPLKFRVVNGEPYAEWVEHTAAEWNKLCTEIALNHIGIEAKVIIMRILGEDDDQ